MADPAAVGEVGESFAVPIERGKIREFARATYSANPDYLDRSDAPVPPTFLTTIFFWADGQADPWPRVRLDQQRGLHAEQEYEFFGPPPRAGQRLTGRSRIVDVYQKQGRRGGTMTFAVMETDFTDETGRLVARARLTGVEAAAPAKAEVRS
ncbi:FAS1-like dehydratase domain-containing protein [Amycolatopsis taiwanensis]|nr:MaoC family dehydratase N-terminal domain-containing protein [Amycolatopsis taiwanensis]